MDVKKQLIEILESRNPIPDNYSKNADSYRYLDAGHIDSLSIIDFILQLETTFNIDITPDDTQSDEFRYVKGLVRIIEKKKNETREISL